MNDLPTLSDLTPDCIRGADAGFTLDVLCLEVLGWQRSVKPNRGPWLYAPDGQPDIPLPDVEADRTWNDLKRMIPQPWRISRTPRGGHRAFTFLTADCVLSVGVLGTPNGRCDVRIPSPPWVKPTDIEVQVEGADTYPLAMARALLLCEINELLENNND